MGLSQGYVNVSKLFLLWISYIYIFDVSVNTDETVLIW